MCLWYPSMWKHATLLTEMLEHQEIITCLSILFKSRNTFHVVTCQLLRTVHCNIYLLCSGLSLWVARGEGDRKNHFKGVPDWKRPLLIRKWAAFNLLSWYNVPASDLASCIALCFWIPCPQLHSSHLNQ